MSRREPDYGPKQPAPYGLVSPKGIMNKYICFYMLKKVSGISQPQNKIFFVIDRKRSIASLRASGVLNFQPIKFHFISSKR